MEASGLGSSVSTASILEGGAEDLFMYELLQSQPLLPDVTSEILAPVVPFPTGALSQTPQVRGRPSAFDPCLLRVPACDTGVLPAPTGTGHVDPWCIPLRQRERPASFEEDESVTDHFPLVMRRRPCPA